MSAIAASFTVVALADAPVPIDRPPLHLLSGPGWTDDEIEECAGLLRATDADAAHWAAGDWLLEREPMNAASAGVKTGTRCRLGDLARRVRRSERFLIALRQTAHSWPPGTRPMVASWHVCRVFTLGGPERAAWRRSQLEMMPRGQFGRVTVETLAAWRRQQETMALRAATPELAAARVTPATETPSEGTRRPAAPRRLRPAEVGDLEQVIVCGWDLVHVVDRLRTREHFPEEMQARLDGLAAALAGLHQALAAHTGKRTA